ncbi:unnamed protein product [Urochloa humidicola]
MAGAAAASNPTHDSRLLFPSPPSPPYPELIFNSFPILFSSDPPRSRHRSKRPATRPTLAAGEELRRRSSRAGLGERLRRSSRAGPYPHDSTPSPAAPIPSPRLQPISGERHVVLQHKVPPSSAARGSPSACMFARSRRRVSGGSGGGTSTRPASGEIFNGQNAYCCRFEVLIRVPTPSPTPGEYFVFH